MDRLRLGHRMASLSSKPAFLRNLVVGIRWLIICAFLLIVTACSAPSEEKRSRLETALRQCLLDLSEMPNGWRTSALPRRSSLLGQPQARRAIAGVETRFKFSGQAKVARAYQHILLFKSPSLARHTYENAPVFERFTLTVPWQESDMISLAELSADAFFLACAEGMGNSGTEDFAYTDCTGVAQYGRAFVAFSSLIAPEFMSRAQYIQVLQDIDRNMIQCVDRVAVK